MKAIIMDMDGTLLNAKNEISSVTLKTLIELEKQGVTLILASGRSYTRLLPYAKQLKMDVYGGFLLEVDGIAIYDMKADKRTVLRQMEYEEIKDLFAMLMQLDCESMACFDDGMFDYFPASIRNIKEKLRKERQLPESYPWTAGPWDWLADMRQGYPNIHYIQSVDEIFGPINKIQIMQDEDVIANLYESLKEKVQGSFEIFRTCPRQLEILPLGYSKGKTLLKLMHHFGWKPNDVLAFGDGENDVSMFEVVEHSFAMANAKEFVKEKAKHVTSSNNEDGIVAGIESVEGKVKCLTYY